MNNEASPPAPAPHPHRITMWQALWFAFAGLLLLVTATLLFASYVGTRELARTQADSLMAGMRRETEARLHRILDPIRQKVLEDYASIRIGRYTTKAPTALKDRLYPNLFALPQVDSLMIGDLTGSQFLVMRYTPAVRASPVLAPVADTLPPPPAGPALQFFTRDFRPAEWGETSRWTLWDDVGRTAVMHWELPLRGYDGRLRPWHKAAMAKFADLPLDEAQRIGYNLVAWTDVYHLFTTKKPGISASIAARDPADRVIIVAYDLLLDEIAQFSTSARPSVNGQLFVLTDDLRLLGAPCDDRPDAAAHRAASLIQPVAATNYPVTAAAVAHWQHDHATEPGQFRFRFGGETWWAGFSSSEIEAGKHFWIGVLLPEQDLVPAASANHRMILVVGGMALLFAALAAGWMARRLANPLTALASQARRIAELDLAPAPEIRSSIAELDTLSHIVAETRESLRLRVAERAAAAAALQHSEARHRTLVESSLIAFVVHQDDFVRYANPAALQLFGYANAAEVVDRMRWDDFVAPEARTELAARIEAAQRGEAQSLHPGWQLLRRDGERRWVQSSITAIEWDGRTAIVAFLRDITELRTATERQATLEEQLRHSQKLEAIGLLAGGIAHDFNNLLQVIGGNAQLADIDELPPAERREAFREISRTVERASKLTRQLLAFGRRQALAREETELNAFVAEHVQMLGRVLPENIRLELYPAPRPLVVQADRGQLEQVLLNLCLNARDAMPKGGTLTLTLAAAPLEAPLAARLGRAPGDPFVRFTVSDSGHGMDRATLSRIFDPFFTTKTRDKGTGLGLAVVYGIIRQHDGHIEAFSEPERGTRFTVHLPFLPDRTVSAPARVPEPVEIAPVSSGTILLAEDNEGIRRIAVIALEKSGYTVHPVADGLQAVAFLEQQPDAVDLLFFDVMMPGMGGFEAARKCQALRPDIPLVFASGYAADSVDEGESLPPGAHILQKPYRTENLLRLIAQLLAPAGN